MKTKLFLLAALLISTISFSQTSKKGYDYYKSSSTSKMNKGELIDAMAKDANLHRKRPGGINKKSNSYLPIRKRPGRTKF